MPTCVNMQHLRPMKAYTSTMTINLIIYIYMYIYICIYLYVYIYIFRTIHSIYIYTHIYIYTYIYIYTLTYNMYKTSSYNIQTKYHCHSERCCEDVAFPVACAMLQVNDTAENLLHGDGTQWTTCNNHAMPHTKPAKQCNYTQVYASICKYMQVYASICKYMQISYNGLLLDPL